jgi:hypothetical protein
MSLSIYLGEKIEATYPNIDDLVGILKNKGRGSLMFKKDWKRAYRQFPIVVGVTALSTDSSEPQDINDSPKVSYAFQPFSFVSAPPKSSK